MRENLASNDADDTTIYKRVISDIRTTARVLVHVIVIVDVVVVF